MGLPYKLGNSGPEITRWQEWFQKMYKSYAPPVDGVFDADDSAAVRELQRRLGLTQSGVFDKDTAARVRFVPARHLALVFRGTGGIIGQDYVSLVCQSVSDLVEEINPVFPATMGGLPVGAAGGPRDASMTAACKTAFEDAKRIFQTRYNLNPRIKVVVGGYSAGAVAAAMFRQWLQLYYPDNYLCSFSFGDPTRPVGGCYFAGTPTTGRGISSWHYGDVRDWRHCWLAAPGDMYTSVPDGPVGDIMDTAYDMVTNVQISDPLGTARAMIGQLPVILGEAGISLPAIFGSLATGPVGLITWMIPMAIGALQGMIGELTGLPDANSPGTAAAAEAAMIALKFVASQPPTAAHIQYHIRETLPGMTYLDLARSHVRDWCSRVNPS